MQGIIYAVITAILVIVVAALVIVVYVQAEGLFTGQVTCQLKFLAQGGGQGRLGMIQPLIGAHAAGLLHPGAGEGLPV